MNFLLIPSSPEGATWQDYASAAMTCAFLDDWAAVQRYLSEMQERHGTDALIYAMVAWMDTAVAATPGVAELPGNALVVPEFQCVEHGPGCSDPVPPEWLWVGRIMTARTRGDTPIVAALIDAIPDDDDDDEYALGRYVGALLFACVMAVSNPTPLVTERFDVTDVRDAPETDRR